MKEIIITDFLLQPQSIIISYKSSEKIEAWLEDFNKHNPNIMSLDIDYSRQQIVLAKNKLKTFTKDLQGHKLKLSLCNKNKRLIYSVTQFEEQKIDNICVRVVDNCILFYIEGNICSSRIEYEVENISHKNNCHFEGVTHIPIDLLDIGTCFSRSIFKSDEYFNPSYKKFFCVKETLFHNSFISLFSNRFDFDYSNIDDLVKGDAGKYIGIEFTKNMDALLKENAYQLIVVDNYIDAVSPIIKIQENTYLTYNKYFSESIFKRFFSFCEIIYPGTDKHLSLYKQSIRLFNNMLKKYNIKNVVLIGGRLSKFKLDNDSVTRNIWVDKMDWILSTNHIWDEVDKIFLEEIPTTFYFDKRKTNWISDNQSPIIGGASPSHYQSGYYKELYKDLLQLINEDIEYGT